MSVEVAWADMPKEVDAIVRPLIEKYLCLLPGWCLHLGVGMKANDSSSAGNVAHIVIDPEYRQAKVFIHPEIVLESPRNRERTIIHEFYHVPMAPLVSWTRGIISQFIDDDNAKNHLLEELRHYEEGVVQDLTFSNMPPVEQPKRKK